MPRRWAVEDSLAQRFAIRRQRHLRSFQGCKNKPCPEASGLVLWHQGKRTETPIENIIMLFDLKKIIGLEFTHTRYNRARTWEFVNPSGMNAPSHLDVRRDHTSCFFSSLPKASRLRSKWQCEAYFVFPISTFVFDAVLSLCSILFCLSSIYRKLKTATADF